MKKENITSGAKNFDLNVIRGNDVTIKVHKKSCVMLFANKMFMLLTKFGPFSQRDSCHVTFIPNILK